MDLDHLCPGSALYFLADGAVPFFFVGGSVAFFLADGLDTLPDLVAVVSGASLADGMLERM